MIFNFLRNETALVSALVTAVTGLLTGPVFKMDPAAVGSITAMVVVVFNIWVRFSVYSKAGAVVVATAAATEAVSSISGGAAGRVGEVTAAGHRVVESAVDTVMDIVKPPGD